MVTPAETDYKARPEARKSKFAIDMRYNSDFLYYLLTNDNHKQTISLDNNIEQITEGGYDIFRLATINLTSDLKVKSQPDWPDRSTKTLLVAGGLWNNTWINAPFQQNKIPVLMDALADQGINSDLLADDRSYNRAQVLVVKDLNPSWALKINCLFTFYKIPSLSYFRTMMAGVQIIYPYPQQLGDLHSPAEIHKAITHHAKIMEKVIRAFYQAENKHLPMEKLVFVPNVSNEVEAKKYFATCTYCKSDYSIVNGPTCPHCSASKPIFGTTHT